jgi:hypothetical protein
VPPSVEWERVASEVAATLRSEACRDPTTVTCKGWPWSCRPGASRSAPRRAAHNVRFHNAGIKRFHHPVVGALVLSFDDETVRRRLTIAVYTARARLPSHDMLNLLASLTATLDQAEAANAVDGL